MIRQTSRRLMVTLLTGAVAAGVAAAQAQAPVAGPQTGRTSITIEKQVINTTQVPTGNAQFKMQVDCSPSGPHTVVTLTAPNSLTQTLGVAVGASCTVVELPPMAPTRCKWNTSYPRGNKTNAGGRVVVVNELRCETGGGGLTVTKVIVNKTPISTPAGPYRMRVNCTPNGPSTVISLSPPATASQVVPVTAGSQCTVTELPPTPPPAPCHWDTSYMPANASAGSGGTVTVTNTLVCRPPT